MTTELFSELSLRFPSDFLLEHLPFHPIFQPLPTQISISLRNNVDPPRALPHSNHLT